MGYVFNCLLLKKEITIRVVPDLPDKYKQYDKHDLIWLILIDAKSTSLYNGTYVLLNPP